MKHLITLTLVSVIICAQLTEPTQNTRNCVQKVELEHVLLDSIYYAVLNKYPLELFDSTSWAADYGSAVHPDPTLVQIPKAPTNAFELIRALGDTAAELQTYNEAMKFDSVNAVTIDTVIAYRFTKDYGYLRITGLHRSDSLIARLERALTELGDIGGLALDITGTINGSEEPALQAAGFLTREPYKAYIVRKRTPYSSVSEDDTVWVRPQGSRQYSGPIVVATEHNWTSEGWTCLVQAMRSRKNTRFTRGGDYKGSYFRGMRTQRIAMPNSLILFLPTAALTDTTGKLVRGEKCWVRNPVMTCSIDWSVYISNRDMTGPAFMHVNECWITLNSMTGRPLRP